MVEIDVFSLVCDVTLPYWRGYLHRASIVACGSRGPSEPSHVGPGVAVGDGAPLGKNPMARATRQSIWPVHQQRPSERSWQLLLHVFCSLSPFSSQSGPVHFCGWRCFGLCFCDFQNQGLKMLGLWNVVVFTPFGGGVCLHRRKAVWSVPKRYNITINYLPCSVNLGSIIFCFFWCRVGGYLMGPDFV